jgi:hypothetical protein
MQPSRKIQTRTIADLTPSPVRAPVARMSEPPLATVDTSVWGADLWLILHVASVLAMSDSQKNAFAAVLASLRTGIPCPECSGHFNNWYSSHPTRNTTYSAQSQHKLASKVFRIGNARVHATEWVPFDAWIANLHNDVNRRRGVEQWDIVRVTNTYRHKSLTDVRQASVRLHGVIRRNACSAIDNLLNAIGA